MFIASKTISYLRATCLLMCFVSSWTYLSSDEAAEQT